MRMLHIAKNRNGRPVTTVIMGALIVSLSIAPRGVKAEEVLNQSNVKEFLSAANAGRNLTASVKLPLQIGFFGGQPALYITPEVGVKAAPGTTLYKTAQSIATGFNANFIPGNFATLPNSKAIDDIFVFTDGSQGNILASAPHPAGPNNKDPNYTPLWQVSTVTRAKGNKTIYKSTAAVLAAQKAGQVNVQLTPIIVECSVIFTPSGGLLPKSTLFVR